MNSIYLLIHKYPVEGKFHREIISAHPTPEVAARAERFFRGYSPLIEPHMGHTTDIQEVDFEG